MVYISWKVIIIIVIIISSISSRNSSSCGGAIVASIALEVVVIVTVIAGKEVHANFKIGPLFAYCNYSSRNDYNYSNNDNNRNSYIVVVLTAVFSSRIFKASVTNIASFAFRTAQRQVENPCLANSRDEASPRTNRSKA